MLRSSSFRRYARMVKRAGRLLTGRDVLYRYDTRPRRMTLGTVYGGWTIVPAGLDANSVMYSFGVGDDISFDLAAIELFGLQVHGFDPSPHVPGWIASQILPPKYTFHAYGLGVHDGTTSFFVPSGGNMYSVRERHGSRTKKEISLPVRSLLNIVQSLDTHCIDVLKIDIEGAEYDILPSIISCPVLIKQLLIEFHHRIGVASLDETVSAVQHLRAAGFRLFHVSETSSEFSFVHNDSGTG
jgi:FkbM family methyltransferase